jgi:hypothetical protein
MVSHSLPADPYIIGEELLPILYWLRLLTFPSLRNLTIVKN